MRYTESRLTPIAMALLDGIDEDAVDLRPNYDGSDSEPVVLPAAFPNLLANGSSGIAVGMATSIPPHNAAEVLAALAWMVDRSGPVSNEEVLRHIKGPDLPTGGLLIEPEASVTEAYRTGRGSFRIRARWEREELAYGQYQVIVTEIPYQVQKARLIERIADLLGEKKLPLLADLRDESTDVIRLVLIPRSRAVTPELLMEQLFRTTELEVRLSLNMNVLDRHGVPRVMSLVEVLEAFIEHRMEVLIRRSNHRLRKVEERLEILDGYLKAFLDIDEVIRIIREEDEPKPSLMKRFDLLNGVSPISLAGDFPIAMVVPASGPFASFEQFRAAAAGRSADTLTYGTLGVGSFEHLLIASLCNVLQIRATHVPYKGGAELVQALLGGQIDFAYLLTQLAQPYVAKGQMRALATLTRERNAILPDTPTFSELKVPVKLMSYWAGICAPASTPDAVADRLHRIVVDSVQEQNIKAWLEQGGSVPRFSESRATSRALIEGDQNFLHGFTASLGLFGPSEA